MVRKRVIVPPILIFFTVVLAAPPGFYPDYWQYSWWLLYEDIIHDRHYERCWWPDDITGSDTTMYDFEYDEELDCYLKPGSD